MMDQNEKLTVDVVRQFYIFVEEEEFKQETLFDLYETLSFIQTIVFCNSRLKLDHLAEKMSRKWDIKVAAIPEDMGENERRLAIHDFLRGATRVLVTTEHLGINPSRLSLLINYDLPMDRETYVQRIGPSDSGRLCRKGAVLNFVTEEDKPALKDIESHFDIVMEEMPMNIADLL